MNQRTHIILFLIILFSLSAQPSYAQIRRIAGQVVSAENGEAVASVSVTVVGRNLSVQTNNEGRYSISLPLEASELEFRSIGYQAQRVAVGNNAVLDVQLISNLSEVDEVIVTGVAVGTTRERLPFSVTKVGTDKIATVPALDVSQTLRGKVAGITISQTEGDGAASVFLRGAKSFGGNISPLIVIDGYVSNLTLGDLNPQDVESIEVIKGASAAALYGTRAEGGVIQVITKKGKDAFGKLNITVDNEYGTNDIQRTPTLASSHRWVPSTTNEFGFEYAAGSTTSRIPNYEDNGFSLRLSPYVKSYDNINALLGNRPFYTNFISLSTAGEKYNTYLSFQNQVNEGVLEPVDANVRRTAKLNLQLRPVSKLELEANLHYFYNSRPSDQASGGGQGTFFASILQYEPFINLSEKDASGEYVAVPRGYDIQGALLSFNPLYQYSQIKYKNYNNEILAGGRVKYKALPNLSFEAAGSINQYFSNGSTLYPKGFQTATPNDTYNNGYLSLSTGGAQFINAQAQVNYHETFGDFDFSANLKSVYEYSYNKSFGVSGFDFSVPLYTIDNTRADTRSGSGSDEKLNKTVNYGYFLNAKVSYQDKLFLDVLGRIDQSSRFGVDVQSAFFPRISAAYRLTKDLDLGNGVNELKLRASWGQAGRLPSFGAKESRATVSNTGISLNQNENTNLKRSITSELEVGFDARIFNQLNLAFNYASAKSRGDFVSPPVFWPTLGTTGAVKNFGLINSHSFELELGGKAITRENFEWDLGFTFARTRSEIKELGDGLPAWASGLYYKDVGLSPYAFYGNKILTSLSELEVQDGFVVNAALGQHPLEAFVVNSQGHVVLKSTLGTADEKPLLLEENGASKSVVIGDGQSDFVTGLNTTFTFFKNLSLYTTLDWNQGGRKYNQTIQYLTFADRSDIWEDYARAGLPLGYLQTAYNGDSYTDFWIEDNSYLSLREISLSYSLPYIKGWSSVVKGARIALTGRNLYTWTSFSGVNPEGYSEYFPYPVYRTYTAKLTFNF